MWELRVYLGRDATGKVHHRHARFHGGKRQAERELARLVAEDGDGDVVLDWGPETTINDAVLGWQRNSLRMTRHAVSTRELQSGGSPIHVGLTRLEGHGGRSPPRQTPPAAPPRRPPSPLLRAPF